MLLGAPAHVAFEPPIIFLIIIMPPVYRLVISGRIGSLNAVVISLVLASLIIGGPTPYALLKCLPRLHIHLDETHGGSIYSST